ncbi:MAG: ATPase [Clostridia bacterium]|nr:ATPase [Clostridia bacterium]
MRSIEELLANIDDIMDRAKAVPFSSDKCIVDARELNSVIDEIRMNLPQEIRQSKAVMNDRENIISSATKEADEITAKAQERARAMVNQEAIFKEAKEKAEKIISAAEEQANEILRGAFTFSDNILLDTENAVNQNLETVRQARKNLRTAVKTRAAANRARQADSDEAQSDSEQE